jgi:hypothetical protein
MLHVFGHTMKLGHSQVKRTLGCFVALIAISVAAHPQSVNVSLSVQPFPSPYISDLASDPTFIQVTVTSTEETPRPAFFDIVINSSVHGQLASGRSRVITVMPGTDMINGYDLISWNDITYNQSVRSQVALSGVLPEAFYTICLTLKDNVNLQVIANEACGSFTITLPEPPSLLLPADNELVMTAFPMLQWTTVNQPGHQVFYSLKIAEVVQGQTPYDALQSGYPHYANTSLTATSLLYPVEALALVLGRRYAWQVRAVNELGNPVGQNDGRSEIWTFRYLSDATPQSSQGFTIGGFGANPTRVTDSSRTSYTGEAWINVPFLNDSVFVAYSGLTLDENYVVTSGDITVASLKTMRMGQLRLRLDTLKFTPTSSYGWGLAKLSLGSDSILIPFASLGFGSNGFSGSVHSTHRTPISFGDLDQSVDSIAITLVDNNLEGGYLRGRLKLPFPSPNDSVFFLGDFENGELKKLRVSPGFSLPLPGMYSKASFDSVRVFADSAFLSGNIKMRIGTDSAQIFFKRLLVNRQGITGTLNSETNALTVHFGGVIGHADSVALSFHNSMLDSGFVMGRVRLPFPSPNDSVFFKARYSDGNIHEALIASEVTFPMGPVQMTIDTLHFVHPDTASVTGRALLILNSEVLEGDSLLFVFRDMQLTSSSFAGTILLGNDVVMNLINPNDFTLKFKRDVTHLTIQNGTVSVSLTGSVLPPAGALKDSAGRRVEIPFSNLSVDSDGNVYLSVATLPRSQIANTGFHVQGDSVVVDFSSLISPGALNNDWKGVFIRRGRVALPEKFSKQGAPVSFFAHGLSIGTTGFNGRIAAAGLTELANVKFNRFAGHVDSVMVNFTNNSVDEGYAKGLLTIPFINGDVNFSALVTDAGLREAMLGYDGDLRVCNLSFFKMNLTSASLSYTQSLSKVSLSGRISIEKGGSSIKDVSFEDFQIDSDGNVGVDGKVWFNLTGNQGSAFEGFPIQLDSLGFGKDPENPNRQFIGVGARIEVADNLPSGNTTLIFWVKKSSNTVGYVLENVEVKDFGIAYQSAAFSFEGQLKWSQDTTKRQFDANLAMQVKSGLTVASKLMIGRTLGANGFRYWYIDGKVGFGGTPIFSLLPATGIPISFYGFGGGAFYHMKAVVDTVNKKVVYTPDNSVALGLKATVILGTDGGGLAWNGDQELEFVFSQSGNNYSLTNINLYSRNWFLAPLPARTNPVADVRGNGTLQISVNNFSISGYFNFTADFKTLVQGVGTAQLLFGSNNWFVKIGTRQEPVDVHIYPLPPLPLNLAAKHYFQIDKNGIQMGVGFHINREKKVGIFKGELNVDFTTEASLAYRPFRIEGSGELDGNVKAKVKALGDWYEIFNGQLLANVNFKTPNPTRVWGRVKMRYSVAGGAVKGTYKMSYSFPEGSSDEGSENEFASFPLVEGLNPMGGQTATSLGAVEAFLGIAVGEEYFIDENESSTNDDVYWKLVVDSVRIAKFTRTINRRTGAYINVYTNLPNTIVLYSADKFSLTCSPSGYALLEPNTIYRTKVRARLLKKSSQSNWQWQTFKDTTAIAQFTTGGIPEYYYEFVESTYPKAGEKAFRYGGNNLGRVHMRFNSVLPAISSGQVVGQLFEQASSALVPGSWAPPSSDNRWWAFTPTGNSLQPNRMYVLRLVDLSVDSTNPARQKYSMSFETGSHASLPAFAEVATKTSEKTLYQIGSPPVLFPVVRKFVFSLTGRQTIDWDNVTSYSLQSIAGTFEYLPSSRRALILGGGSKFGGGGGGTFGDWRNSIVADAQTSGQPLYLPQTVPDPIQVIINHRYEGAVTVSFPRP